MEDACKFLLSVVRRHGNRQEDIIQMPSFPDCSPDNESQKTNETRQHVRRDLCNKRDSHSRPRSVALVLFSKECCEVYFFVYRAVVSSIFIVYHSQKDVGKPTFYARVEEHPQKPRKCDGAKRVSQHELRSDCPPVVPEVRGMPQVSVIFINKCHPSSTKQGTTHA
jgi:hypothetical protein